MTNADQAEPSTIVAPAENEAPGPRAPSGPQIERPREPRLPNPWVVIAAALATGYLLAKILYWRGDAHPRYR
jgi:hypothetical protein